MTQDEERRLNAAAAESINDSRDKSVIGLTKREVVGADTDDSDGNYMRFNNNDYDNNQQASSSQSQ